MLLLITYKCKELSKNVKKLLINYKETLLLQPRSSHAVSLDCIKIIISTIL